MRSYVLLTTLVVLLTHASASAAQQTTKTISVPSPAGAGSLGFRYGGVGVELLGNGQARWAKHPAVVEVLADSEAAKLGIRSGDVILLVNGKDARDPSLFDNRRPGTKYVLRLRRGEEEREVTVSVYLPTDAERANILPQAPQPSSPDDD